MQTKQLGRLPVVHFAAGGVVTPADAALMTRIGHNFLNHETLGIGLSFLISAVSVGLDLSRNYINGTVPRTFGLLRIKFLSLLGNRISGSIPEEIANISTLEELVLEDNQLGGLLPQNLGSMSSLRRLFLSANNFTGTIPETFGGLKTLIDFRIDGSELSRKIGDFIRNWTNITRLDLQGTSMEGTIPSNILHLPFEKLKRVEDI